jgi:nicotinate-nucleotide adenylyltransferase
MKTYLAEEHALKPTAHRRIALYGGSFNPIHLGHLNLAIEMLEKQRLTKIYFCPAALSPFKLESSPVAAHHRLAMLQLATEEIPQFAILESELTRASPSYTIDTIDELLLEARPSDTYFLIVGQDALPTFHLWHRWQEIIKKMQLLIGCRMPATSCAQHGEALQQAINAGMTPTRQMEISSSEVRLRLQQNMYCRHLLPTKVMDYIYANRLYL